MILAACIPQLQGRRRPRIVAEVLEIKGSAAVAVSDLLVRIKARRHGAWRQVQGRKPRTTDECREHIFPKNNISVWEALNIVKSWSTQRKELGGPGNLVFEKQASRHRKTQG